MAILNIPLTNVQPLLVSGTNIKTINGVTLLGAGDLTISASASWGGITGTLSDQTDLNSALSGKQATLVSGTNIKSINGTSLLGSGDLTIASGVSIGDAIGSATAGSVLFAGVGGVLAQQNTKLFWDNTNYRLGIGTPTPVSALNIAAAPTATANYGLVSLGSGAFDGSTSGYFTGSANGTVLAVNAASGYSGDLVNLQKAGVLGFKVTSTGQTYTSDLYIGSDGSVINNRGGKLYSTGGELLHIKSGENNGNSFINMGLGQVSVNATQVQLNAGGYLFGVGRTYNNASVWGATASSNYQMLNLSYTINNGSAATGGATVTGIFLNATETALNGMTHNLINLQVGGASMLKVTNAGNTTLAGTIRFGEFTVATLPSSPSVGDKCFVNDASGAAVVGSIVVGGGATRVEVVWAYGGAGWKITARY